MPQEYNNQLIKSLSTDFPRRREPNYAWGNVISGFLMTPGLRAYWPVSSIEVTLISMTLYDMSAQGRHLHCINPD